MASSARSLTELHSLCRESPGLIGQLGGGAGGGGSASSSSSSPSSSSSAGGPAADAAALGTRVSVLKAEMLAAARRSHALQSELQELERLIALHIRHRMEVEDKWRSRLGGTRSAARTACPLGPRLSGRRAGHVLVPRLSNVPGITFAGTPKRDVASVKGGLPAEERSKYETLTYLVRVNPWWLAQVLQTVDHKGKPQLLHLILDVVYADMHDEDDDVLLLTLFGEALEREVKKAADKATFMRDNTALTELMSKYNQRDPGREALVAILTAPVTALMSRGADFSIECQPLAVYRDLIESGQLASAELPEDSDPSAAPPMPTAEEAAKMPEVADEVARRLELARGVAASFLDAITAAAAIEALPFGTRWIAKTVYTLAKKRFGASTEAEAQTIYTLLGGFVFLRCASTARTATLLGAPSLS